MLRARKQNNKNIYVILELNYIPEFDIRTKILQGFVAGVEKRGIKEREIEK